jgi:hypothetical protein
MRLSNKANISKMGNKDIQSQGVKRGGGGFQGKHGGEKIPPYVLLGCASGVSYKHCSG